MALLRRLISDREKLIGARLRAFRETLQIPRTKFALSIHIGSERLAAYEAGRSRLPYVVFKSIANRYNLSPLWLAEEKGGPQFKNLANDADFIGYISRTALFSEVYDCHMADAVRDKFEASARYFEEGAQKFIDLLGKLKNIPKGYEQRVSKLLKKHGFDRALIKAMRNLKKETHLREVLETKLLSIHESKPTVDNSTRSDIVNPVSAKIRTWKTLREQLATATSERGVKVQLATDLGVSRQAVNNWLNGSGAPSADLTLRLLQWVEQRGQK